MLPGMELEAMGLHRVRTEVSVQYMDHNLIQEDFKNADDHLFTGALASTSASGLAPRVTELASRYIRSDSETR
jgi:hypothetical protein